MRLLLLVVLILRGPGFAVEVEPQACPLCVTTRAGAASLFGRAQQAGTVGILAHNYMAGVYFYELEPGDWLALEYADGQRADYAVTHASAYYRHNGLLCNGRCYSEDQVFAREYTGGLVLQTCIGDNQGLYFVHAAKGTRPVVWVSLTFTGGVY